MKSGNREEGSRWLRQAKQDLDDAVFAEGGHRYNLACFLAQQAAEKALKAFLFSQGAEHVWGHSAIELCNDAVQFDKQFLEIKADAAALDTYDIPTRYPNGLPGGIPAEAYQQEDAVSAIDKAKRIISIIDGKLRII